MYAHSMQAGAAAVEASRVWDAGEPRRLGRAVEDLRAGLAAWRFALGLARADLRTRYRGSVIGPFWITLTTGVMIAAFGLLYARIFDQPCRQHLLHVGVGLVTWTWISQAAREACTALTGAEALIRQAPLPVTVHVLRVTLRNLMVAAHHMVLLPPLFLVCGHLPGPGALAALAGVALIAVNSLAFGTLLGFLVARFRDVGPIIDNLLQLLFFVSPILWDASALGDARAWLLANPVYVLVETVRGPLLHHAAPAAIWVAALGLTGAGLAFAAAAFVRFRERVAFWV
jgi:lipopolysaccharide transport system permease protein